MLLLSHLYLKRVEMFKVRTDELNQRHYHSDSKSCGGFDFGQHINL